MSVKSERQGTCIHKGKHCTMYTPRLNDEGRSEYAFLITNEKLYQITKTTKIESFIDQQFLKYTAHVTRMSNDKWQKQLAAVYEIGGAVCEGYLEKCRWYDGWYRWEAG